MPNKTTVERARRARRQGKAPTTQAGEFVHEEIEHVRRGKHGARSPKQAIAIGLSKARRSGVEVPPPRRGRKKTRRSAQAALRRGRTSTRPSARRSRAASRALKRERRSSVSRVALARQARSAARARRGKKTGSPGKRAGSRGRRRSRS